MHSFSGGGIFNPLDVYKSKQQIFFLSWYVKFFFQIFLFFFFAFNCYTSLWWKHARVTSVPFPVSFIVDNKRSYCIKKLLFRYIDLIDNIFGKNFETTFFNGGRGGQQYTSIVSLYYCKVKGRPQTYVDGCVWGENLL